MKKYLAGFGIIMTAGFVIALVGSNPASTMLASLLTATTDALTQTTATTSETSIVTEIATTSEVAAYKPEIIATTTDALSEIKTSTTSGSTTTHFIDLDGMTNGEIVSSIRPVTAKVDQVPVAAYFVISMTGAADRVVMGVCTKATGLLTGATYAGQCTAVLDPSLFLNSEGYGIIARASYPDGTVEESALVMFTIANINRTPEFVFLHPTEYAKISGDVSVRGNAGAAIMVKYDIFASTNKMTPIATGRAEQIDRAWVYRWNTDTVKNGNYYIIPTITNRYGEYKGKPISVTVYNESSITATRTILELATQQPISEQAIKPAATPETTKLPEAITIAAGSEEKTDGFFENVRGIFRSVIVPKTEPAKPAEVQRPAGSGSEAIRLLEQVVVELKEASQETGDMSQGALARITKDTDNDGISDYQETGILRTDPYKKDTDGDGISDGTEIRQGTNPMNTDRSVTIRYENAKSLGETVKQELLKIDTVALATTTVVIEVETATGLGKTGLVKEKKRVVKEKIKLAGRALPYAWVTIYVYSDIPTIITVKADKNGSWSYALDKPLDDGQHQAYVTINDSSGKIVAKSQVFGFVKTAQAITVVNSEGLTQVAEAETAEPVEVSKRNFGIIVALIIGLGLLTGVFMVVRSFKGSKVDFI